MRSAERREASRILVIDDDPDVLSVMVDALIEAGYTPQWTTDSREAAALLAAGPFDVVVSDVAMAHLNGFTLLRAAKRQDPAVEVILVTGAPTRAMALEALDHGAAGFLEKPFRPEELVGMVHQALWRRQVRPRAS